ncbi:MAG: XRE family transcriptional regulator [Erysipelotrichaceae bacterium]
MKNISDIGTKIKQIRTKQHLTLKQLSDLTQLSIGFLSQLERGQSNIAIDTLQIIAKSLNVNLSYFIEEYLTPNDIGNVQRDFEKKCSIINPILHSYIRTNNNQLPILPREYHLLPSIDTTKVQAELYHHEGKEWIYVLEGILSITLDKDKFDLYPGDTITIDSTKDHNWYNRTNQTTKFLSVNYPNPLLEEDN